MPPFTVASGNPAFVELFNHTPHPMYVYDVQTLRFLAANPVALSTYGYTREEFQAMTLYGIRSVAEQLRLREHLASSTLQISGRGRWQHLRKDGAVLYVDITTYALVFDSRPANMVLAVDMTQQVLAEERTAEYVKHLELALESTLGALSAMGEMRDLYTAGHQKRVGHLASAIAVEMGLDPEQQQALGVMGLVHDIGKIGIPVDILNKPSPLHAVEYELVKRHVEMGYDILAPLTFKWPVAEVVLQHHERLDGSGYPNAIKGGEIRLEARILAAADVLESMATRRPYRSALGEVTACEELINGAGTLYDADVANACVRLVRDRGYSVH
jgi:PAS domain S-box-containing protein